MEIGAADRAHLGGVVALPNHRAVVGCAGTDRIGQRQGESIRTGRTTEHLAAYGVPLAKALSSVRHRRTPNQTATGGRPRRITRAKERSVAATMRPPKAATHWSARRLAKEVGLSPATVHRIWQKYGLPPHRVEKLQVQPRSGIRRSPLLTSRHTGQATRPLGAGSFESAPTSAALRSRPLRTMLPWWGNRA